MAITHKSSTKIWLTASMLIVLTACASTLDKLDQVGKPPAMTNVQNPTTKPDYRPLSWPMPDDPKPTIRHANSLWQPGSRAFFRDQRAGRVGDILRVKIEIDDRAELNNQTRNARDNSDSVGIPKVFGLEKKVLGILPGTVDPDNLLSTNSNSDLNSTARMKREEKLTTMIPATVTQILPNGNMVISGKQEIRINFEIREVAVDGVVRPQDINSDNTIDSNQVAEARIIYGGRGQITDKQQPRWGSQVIEAVAPF